MYKKIAEEFRKIADLYEKLDDVKNEEEAEEIVVRITVATMRIQRLQEEIVGD